MLYHSKNDSKKSTVVKTIEFVDVELYILAKARGNQKISAKTIEAVAELLDKLEPKIEFKLKLEQTPDEKLFNLRHKIERVLRLGYSYEEIVEVLKQQEINISTEKLKKHLSNADDQSELF